MEKPCKLLLRRYCRRFFKQKKNYKNTFVYGNAQASYFAYCNPSHRDLDLTYTIVHDLRDQVNGIKTDKNLKKTSKMCSLFKKFPVPVSRNE